MMNRLSTKAICIFILLSVIMLLAHVKNIDASRSPHVQKEGYKNVYGLTRVFLSGNKRTKIENGYVFLSLICNEF